MNKTDIRNRFIEIRNDISKNDVRTKSERILAQVESIVEWNKVRNVHAYTSVSKWNEVDTKCIEKFIYDTYPNIQLIFSNPDRSSEIPTTQYDLILVPMLAFDSKLHRIGFGGGWYDRFLTNQSAALKLGLAYDVQEYEELPFEGHDVALDCIVTETRVIKKSASRLLRQ